MAEVAALFTLARQKEQEEEEARLISVFNVPRKKRTHRSSHRSMVTQWTRVVEKQRAMEIQNPNSPPPPPSSCFVESKKRCVSEEDERSIKKRRIVRRFEVASSIPKEVELRVQQYPNLESSRVSKKPKTVLPTQTNPHEWLLNVMMREGNGYNPKLIIAKNLFQTDLERAQGRLSMPLKQVVNSDFLTEEEATIIHEQSISKRHREGVSVELVDPLLNKHVVDLRKWKMSGSWNYVFVDGWNDVVAKNKFKVKNVFHVWSFRSGNGKLCFALVPPPPPTASTSG